MYRKTIDPYLVFIIMMLVILWVIMISSVSVYPSFKITSQYVAKWLLEEPNNSFYLSRNFLHLTIGIAVLTFFTKLTYTYLEKYHRVALVLVLTLMTIVLVIWKELNGAKWWIDIPGLPSIQPVEFAKIGIIIFLAAFIKRKRSLMSSFEDGAVPYFAIVWVLFLLLALQPDFWSILILAPLVVALYFVWWWNPRFIILIFLIAAVWAGSVYGLWKLGGDESKSKLSYISKRIDSFFQSSETLFANKEASNQDYQIKQWLIAIWSWWFWWLGFGKSIQKFWYLPEVQWDFIFSVFVEELWFLWAAVLIVIYLSIIHRWYQIARWVKDPFWKYLAFGITTLILIQIFVNIWVNLNVIPLTGVTLPFVSYGWSSLIALMAGIGILLNISRYVEFKSPSSGYEFVKKRRVYHE